MLTTEHKWLSSVLYAAAAGFLFALYVPIADKKPNWNPWKIHFVLFAVLIFIFFALAHLDWECE